MTDSTNVQTGRYKAYPEHKDSGVEWLGKIPSGWIVTNLKRYCKVTDGSHHSPSVQSEGLPFVSVTDVGINSINFEDAKKITNEDFIRLVKEGCKPSVGDVLLTKDGTIGRACIVKEEMPEFVILSSLGLLTPTQNLTENYLYYYLISGTNIDQMNSVIHGSALRRLTIKKINELILITPKDKAEQLQIANFLDYETAKIDTLIEKQQRLIELLTEKRQAVISHAVTKGLNPDVTMKDSGVEWLGEVPAHWEVSPLKFYIDTRKGVAFKSADFTGTGIRVVKASDIKNKTIRTSDIFLPKNYYDSYSKAILNAGDIILSTVGSTPEVKNSAVGQIGLVPDGLEGSLLNQNTVVFNPKSKDLLNLYLFYLLQTDTYRDHLDLNAHGTANQASLNVSDMLNFTFARPPINEQSKIGKFIESTNETFNNLEVKAQNAIQLMQERRTALISSAVTGKIDVRDWEMYN